MRVLEQVLVLSMKNGEEAELRTQEFGVASACQQGFGGGAEQDVIDRCLVVKGDSGDLTR